jgi:hypothetical protein
MSSTSRFRAFTAVLLACSAGAAAQCNYSVPGIMPDFDQRRMAALGIPGLPNNGNSHCVPTSVVNLFAYFANRGISQPATLAGPDIWWHNSTYNKVTNTVQLMGAFMGTDPMNGTAGGTLPGTKLYIMMAAPGRVIATRAYCPTHCPTPARFYFTSLLGGYMAFCYGRYVESPPGSFTRNGGHSITFVSITGACGSSPVVGFRDPANDAANTTQSSFVTHDVGLVNTPGFFNVGGTFTFGSRYRMLGYNTPSFIDSWLTLFPTHGICLSPGRAPGVQVLRPFQLEGSTLPAEQSFLLPAIAESVIDFCLDSDLLSYWVLADKSVGDPTGLFRVSPATGESQLVIGALNFSKLASNRFGELYITDGTMLRAFQGLEPGPAPAPPPAIASRELAGPPLAIACDDLTDTVMVVVNTGPSSARIVKYSRDLMQTVGSFFLPAGVSISGPVSIALHPEDGSFFMASEGIPFVHQLTESNGQLVLVRTITLPPGSIPRSLNVNDDGHIILVNNNVLKEYEQDSEGRFVESPESLYAGREVGRLFRLAVSRDGHVPELHEGPGWVSLEDPEIVPGVEDCYANCDESTTAPVLNVADFACFLRKFAAGDPYANCDDSSTLPVLNVADFTCFLQKFAAGCP